MRTPGKILNHKGEEVTLNAREQYLANNLQNEYNSKLRNALGFEIPVTTLTTIMKSVVEQKFFQNAPAEYFPVIVGEGAFSSQLTTYRSFDLSGEFETGIINTGTDNARLASADAGVDAVNILTYQWAKTVNWSLIDVQQAALSGNWDVITAKEKARKKNWDLGIQRTAFLGADGLNGANGSCRGLLDQPGVTVNTLVIQQPISEMSPEELSRFCGQIYEAYRANCNRTAIPNRFILPESDYNGLAAQSSPQFPIKSKLEVITDMFRVITGRSDFRVMSVPYADAEYHSNIASIAGKQVYTLLNYDEDSVRMTIPVDFTNTMANTLNGFQFQSSAYGQFSGVIALRPLEMLYFQYA